MLFTHNIEMINWRRLLGVSLFLSRFWCSGRKRRGFSWIGRIWPFWCHAAMDLWKDAIGGILCDAILCERSSVISFVALLRYQEWRDVEWLLPTRVSGRHSLQGLCSMMYYGLWVSGRYSLCKTFVQWCVTVFLVQLTRSLFENVLLPVLFDTYLFINIPFARLLA